MTHLFVLETLYLQSEIDAWDIVKIQIPPFVCLLSYPFVCHVTIMTRSAFQTLRLAAVSTPQVSTSSDVINLLPVLPM